MSCFKCSCGCDRLTREELLQIIQSTDRARDFLNNSAARNMFRNMIYPEESEGYTPQPSGSQSRPVGKRPMPRAIKYLNQMEGAAELLRTNNLSDEVVQEFADLLPDMELGDRLYESTSANRTEVLEQIIEEYGSRLRESGEFKNFIANLRKAYDGKVKLEKC
ncbi:uncharacterized protein LOC118505584 [Anopheles stephensi]|uniref:uncharacterized protein LOC118505584 n=1 Tax=Anopheles stephensi TaxID=30069 RepID=UPI00165891CC|nr:uncharacterized protein LOC118505584 [Anopheles stephensi]XP_035897441.1 uncharacterized protein LOC118505584 [Anopheles stephensi]